MLVNVINYSGIHAKICSLKSEFLTIEDFKRLAECADVKSFIELLGTKKAYVECAKEAFEYGTTRKSLERSLNLALYRDYKAIFSFMTKENERKYLDVIFLKYEIGFIKRMLRTLYDRRDIEAIVLKTDRFLSDHLKLNIDKLSGCGAINEFIDALTGTEFYDVLNRINKDTATLFDYETQLDLYRYMKNERYLKKYLDRQNRASQSRLNGYEADLNNILWLYRAKTYYDISAEKIFSYIIPINFRLKISEVKELAACDIAEFLNVLDKTYYRGVFTDLSTMERSARIYLNNEYDRERRANPFSLASVTWHLHNRMQEMKNLTTLIECVRYGLSPNAALSKLIIGAGGEFD